RLHLVRLAIGDNPRLRASDIEFGLPKPSYTVDTLAYLRERYSEREFTLIMGGDNLATLHKWKNYQVLLRDYRIFVYQRPDYELGHLATHPNVQLFEAPLMKISASYIRRCLQAGLSVQYLVTEAVYEYLEGSSLYR
ncbi:MAG: nicotinate-nicotinamide nucleotide adenylyltransferase, partial [Bacteroidetes bacterium]